MNRKRPAAPAASILASRRDAARATAQRPCSWKSPLYEFEVPASYGPASTGVAMIDRAATAARTSLVMAVAPSRLGSAPGSALGSALGGSARIRCLGSVLGFASVFITCEAGVAERRENGGERNHTAKIFFAGHRATARVRTGSHRSRDWVTEVLAYGTAVLVQPG